MAQLNLRTIKDYVLDLDEKLGVGAYGTVHKAYSNKNSQVFAIKIIDFEALASKKGNLEKEVKSLEVEIQLLQKLKGYQQILQIHDVLKSPRNLYLCFEYCEGKTLYEYRKKQKFIKETECIIILEEIIKAFKILHENSIFHRDIKPQNILLKDNQLKLGDFGFSKMVESVSQIEAHTLLGTETYLAPEILNFQKYDEKVDIFAVGIVIFELYFGEHPYRNKTFCNKFSIKFPETQHEMREIIKLLLKHNENPFNRPEFSKKLSNNFENLLLGMLELNNDKRLSWEQIFKHTLFQKKENEIRKLNDRIKSAQNDYLKGCDQLFLFLKEKMFFGEICQQSVDTSEFEKIQSYPENLTLQEITQNIKIMQNDKLYINKIAAFLRFERNYPMIYFIILAELQQNLEELFEIFSGDLRLVQELQYICLNIGLFQIQAHPVIITSRQIKLSKSQKIENFDKILERFQKTSKYLKMKYLVNENIKELEEISKNILPTLKKNLLKEEPKEEFSKPLQQFIKESKPLDGKTFKNYMLGLFEKFKNLECSSKTFLKIWRWCQISLAPYIALLGITELNLTKELDFNFYTYYDKMNEYTVTELKEQIYHTKF